MIRAIKKRWTEIVAIWCAAAFSAALVYWVVRDPSSNFTVFLLSLSLALHGLLLLWALKRLWLKKWRRFVAAGLHTVAEKLIRLLFRVRERLGLSSHRRGELGGKTTVSFDMPILERAERKRKRPIKWKQLQSNRERVRYLYRHMLNDRIRRGFIAHSFETPLELQRKQENEPCEDELFTLYIQTRYHEAQEPSDETVLALKDQLNVK